MLMFVRNKAGFRYNLTFGLLSIADGLVRICSLGLLHTGWPLAYAKRQARIRNLLG